MEERLHHRLTNLLMKLKKKDSYGFFLFPVDVSEVTDYLDVVKHPMDFQTMQQKLERHEYASVQDVARDFFLICENGMAYNKPDTVFYKQAVKLKEAGTLLIDAAAAKWQIESAELLAAAAIAKSKGATTATGPKPTNDKPLGKTGPTTEVAGKKRGRPSKIPPSSSVKGAVGDSSSVAIHPRDAPAPTSNTPRISVPLGAFLSRQSSLQILNTPVEDSLGFATRKSSLRPLDDVSSGFGHVLLNRISNPVPFSAPPSILEPGMHVHRLTVEPEDYSSKDDGWCCSICDEADAYEGNALLRCANPCCLVVVHQLCYGEPDIDVEKPWYCGPCSLALQTPYVPCCLCCSSGGALKPTDRGIAHAQSLSSITEYATKHSLPRIPEPLNISAISKPTKQAAKKPAAAKAVPRASARHKSSDDGSVAGAAVADDVIMDGVVETPATIDTDIVDVFVPPPIETDENEKFVVGTVLSLAEMAAKERHPPASGEVSVPSEWAHVLCAVYIPETSFGNVRHMQPILNVDKIHSKRRNIACRLCKNVGGAVIQCSRGSCGYSVHAQCARYAQLQMVFEYDPRTRQYKHAVHCPKHDDRPMAALSRVPFADRCALLRAEIRRLQEADARKEALQRSRLAAMHERHAKRLFDQKQRQQSIAQPSIDDLVDDGLAAVTEGVAEDMLDYDSATDSDASSTLSDVKEAAWGGDTVQETSAHSDDEAPKVPAPPRRGRKPKPKPFPVDTSEATSMTLMAAAAAQVWPTVRPFFRRIVLERAVKRLLRYLPHRQRTSELYQPVQSDVLQAAFTSVAEHYVKLRERESAVPNTLLPPDKRYTALTSETTDLASNKGDEEWSILTELSKLPPYHTHFAHVDDALAPVPVATQPTQAQERRLLQEAANAPFMHPSFITDPAAEMDNRVLDSLTYKPLFCADEYSVTYNDAVGKDSAYAFRLPPSNTQSIRVRKAPEDLWHVACPQQAIHGDIQLNSHSADDSAFEVPDLGSAVVDTWSAHTGHIADQNSLPWDSSFMFGGWGEGDDFSELRQAFPAAFTPSMRAMDAFIQSCGLLKGVRFRFATPDDAKVLHTLNRVNEAFLSSEDFNATITAKNEFVLLATRDVQVDGDKTEEHIVAFVNYYFSWFTDKSFPFGERLSAAKVIYVATLQAIRPDTHPDICNSSSHRSGTPPPSHQPQMSPSSAPRLPSTKGRFRDRSNSAGGGASVGPGSTSTSSRAQTVAAEPKDYYPYQANNPGAEPRTGTILLALALAHAKDVGVTAALVDSTDGAVAYYTKVIGMSPLLRKPDVKYHPMHLDLRLIEPVSIAAPTLASHLNNLQADAKDAAQRELLNFDEVKAELIDSQSALATLQQHNDSISNILLRRTHLYDVAEHVKEVQDLRRRDRRVWKTYYTVYERRAAALAEERRKAEEEMDACCAICGGADSFPKNLILFCDRCNVPVHQQCYGVTHIPDGDWYCLPCQAGTKPAELPCMLCSVRGGPLAPLRLYGQEDAGRVKQWAHIVCASMCPDVLDVEKQGGGNNVNITEKVQGAVQRLVHEKAQDKVCCVCGLQDGVLHSCAIPECKGAVHGLCAVECALVSHNPPSQLTVPPPTAEVLGDATNPRWRFISDVSHPVHPHKLSRCMGPNRDAHTDALHVYCASHRLPIPCRLQQGAQSLSDALQKLASRLPEVMAPATPANGMDIDGLLTDIQPDNQPAAPDVDVQERMLFMALHMATLTEEFCPSSSVDVDLCELLQATTVWKPQPLQTSSVATDITMSTASPATTTPAKPATEKSSIKGSPEVPLLKSVISSPATATPKNSPPPPPTPKVHAPEPHKHALVEDDIVCAVCGEPDSDKDNAIVFCDCCELRVHQACYGITHLPSGPWLCDPCMYKLPAGCVPCTLCSGCGGALKPTDRGISMAAGDGVPVEWAHVICTIWVAEARFADPHAMSPVTGLADIPLDRWKLRCRVCKQKYGAPIQCGEPSCTAAYHVTCGLHDDYFFGYVDPEHTAESSTRSSGRRRRGRKKSVEDVDAATDVSKITYCPKHRHLARAGSERSSKPHLTWYPHRPYLDRLAPHQIVPALKQMWSCMASLQPQHLSLQAFINTPPPADVDSALLAVFQSFQGRKPDASKVGRAKSKTTQPSTTTSSSKMSGHRYPPIMPITSDPSSHLFVPLLRILVTLYGYKLNLKVLGSANDLANKFAASATEREKHGIRPFEDYDAGPKRKKKRGLGEVDVPLGMLLDSAALIEEVDEHELARRHCIYGVTSFLESSLPAVFGRDAVNRVATMAFAAGRTNQARPKAVRQQPAAHLPPDAFILAGNAAVYSPLPGTVGSTSVRGYRRVALLSQNHGGKPGTCVVGGDTAPTNEEYPSPAAIFADSLSFKGGMTVEVLKTDQHGNLVKENVALDNSRYCICRKTYAEDSSVMVGCSKCEDWFHIACFGLTVCVPHTPGYDPASGADPAQLTCLVDPTGMHIDVRNDYICPKCSNTPWGTSA